MESTSPIVVGLDIGTTKIAAIVGRKNEYGKIEILGTGKSDSLGVKRGMVTNINDTIEAIKDAIRKAEEESQVQITNVNVGIAGQHIRSEQQVGKRIRSTPEEPITNEEIEQISNDIFKLVMNPGEAVVNVIPQDYVIDGEKEITHPVGMLGSSLEANYQVIIGQVTAAKNIVKCVESAGIKCLDLLLEPIASSSAVLSAEEKEAGVALVDIGGGTTDIAIFYNGILRHTHVIPFGGEVLTDDIKEGCSILRKHAEDLKIKFGSALASENSDDEIVAIPGIRGREPKEISLRNLASIIQARMQEIIEQVYNEIKLSGYEHKLSAGIVLTGGGSLLKHLVQLTEFMTGMDARIGYPNEHLANQKNDIITSPIYATGVGLVIERMNTIEHLMNLNKMNEIEEINNGQQPENKDDKKTTTDNIPEPTVENTDESKKKKKEKDVEKPSEPRKSIFTIFKEFFDDDTE
ncbi:MAG: cell division protein FtsA [Bacteroidales bacterium]|nr:cell division protein FtsA [Bacteroidales bacterium]